LSPVNIATSFCLPCASSRSIVSGSSHPSTTAPHFGSDASGGASAVAGSAGARPGVGASRRREPAAVALGLGQRLRPTAQARPAFRDASREQPFRQRRRHKSMDRSRTRGLPADGDARRVAAEWRDVPSHPL
jgi:hypothetical protein